MYENVSCLVIFFSFAFKLKVILASSFQDCWMNEGQLENSRALEKVIVFHYGHKTSRRLLRINICMSQIRFALNQIMDWGYRNSFMGNDQFTLFLHTAVCIPNAQFSFFFCLTSSWAPFRADQLIGSRPPPRHWSSPASPVLWLHADFWCNYKTTLFWRYDAPDKGCRGIICKLK